MDRRRDSTDPILESIHVLLRNQASEEIMMQKCIILLRKCPVAREAVLETIARAAKRHVLRNPTLMGLPLEEIRRQPRENDREVKVALSEIHRLMLDKEAVKAWAPELTFWAIHTVKDIGCELVKLDKYPRWNLIETTKNWLDVEIMNTLSSIIVSGILHTVEKDDTYSVDFLMKEALAVEPVLDWILACLAISKPSFILKRLLSSGFDVFRKSSEANTKKAHLRSLTIILEYLVEKKPTIVAESMLNMLKPDSEFLLIQALYMVELLSTSLKTEKVDLVHRIAEQAADHLTPELLVAIHQQRMTKYSDLNIDELKNSVSSILSGSSSFDLTRVFVSIANGEGTFEELDPEIRFVFRDILNTILDKLEMTIHGKSRTETQAMLEKIMIPTSITTADPAYRLLRLTLLSTDKDNGVRCVAKLLTSIRNIQGQTALIQLLKETFMTQEVDSLGKAMELAFSSTSDHKSLLRNILMLTEDAPPESGRSLICQNAKKYLTKNVGLVLQQLKSKDPEVAGIVIDIVSRLKLSESPSATNLVIESLASDFTAFMGLEFDNVFLQIWKVLNKLADADLGAFALITRNFFEKLKRLHAEKSEFLPPKKKEMKSLFTAVQKTVPKASNIMGVGQIGDGVKRRRVTSPDESQKETDINNMVCTFIAETMMNYENEEKLDLLNTVASLTKEIFCDNLIDGDVQWPVPVGRGGQRANLERDLMLLKSLPPLVLPLLEVLSEDWRSLYRLSIIIRAKMNKLLAFWESSRFTKTTSCPDQLQESIQLVTLLGKSGIIPEVLSLTTEIYEFCSPYHLFLLLNAICGFIHCHPPDNDLVVLNFEGVNVELFLTDARNILLENIDRTGHIFHKFFN